MRYSRSTQEAKEVVNDGFLKVFDKIDQYNVELPFKAWLRKIMINASIDQYRKERIVCPSGTGRTGKPDAQPTRGVK